MNIIIDEVSIPADDQGFVLMQCLLCGEFFKIKPEGCYAEDVIGIWCPSCGLKAENCFTDDAIGLVLKETKNYANDLICNEMEKWEKKFRGSFISLKVGRKSQREEEHPIKYGIEALEVEEYPYCKREAKIKPIYKMRGSYCSLCGVRCEEHR